ncbi:cysteine desulfurase family protein [Sporobacter termitidis DSM 10068]|uniref:Cysteine desulfurase family protein n=1 Tax=Sporobacter termitidis DSM 10068 TaxID=1123282 RepID=A0A1M5TJL8_9FIRM|nr:aminotransferase class V-fold PLP-dependent enzyme [Sporobacter termitidis]SHH50533.1 cysteine desulfurase family protein [Sporobacter termitidis DSM 10068]
MIYLDNAATTMIKPASVARNAAWAVGHLSSPGRGGYTAAMDASEIAFECREKVSKLFSVGDPESIVFTFNATHALNIAIKSLVRRGDKVLISGYEHNAVTRPLHAIGARVIVAASELFEPEMALLAFERRLSEDTALVICNHVSNVFGYILPVERIAAACREKHVPFILDASQSAGALDIDFAKLSADYICMPGHKGLYGPQGTGLLLCARRPEGILQGGTGSNSLSQDMPDMLPDRLEAGTHNMPGIAGLSAGLDYIAKKGLKNILSHERALVAEAADGLVKIEKVRVYKSEYEYCQAGVLSFVVDGVPCETVGEELSARGICVRAGLHCAPLAHKTAGTLPNGTVRMSVSSFNTKRDISALVSAVEEIVRRG